MLDSGLTAELITPELRQHLGIKGSKGKVAGLAAGGASAAGDLVSLCMRQRLCCAYIWVHSSWYSACAAQKGEQGLAAGGSSAAGDLVIVDRLA
jgi:hypothetical protein